MSDLLAGGRYKVVRRLAQGGMGEVLLAEFPGDQTLLITPGYVVLKRVLPEAQNRAHQTAMLREEARISLRLLHENLVESFFCDEHEGDPILVMEYLAGRSMAQVLGQAKKRKEFLPIESVLALTSAAACGLHFAHSLSDAPPGSRGVGRPLGLIHRDVSPANVFVTFDGRVKVIDFGVAKADDSEIRTSTGVLKGKLGYMSPEHAAGEVKLTPATDLWSLGVVMWESLCSERLFASPAPSETLRAISEKPIPPPTLLRKDCPPRVAALCMSLLDRDPDRRIGTGRDLVSAIESLEEARGLAQVDLGGFLSARFPDEAAAGQLESKKCAHMRRKTPVPIGLVQGTASQAPTEGDTPTIVMKTSDALAMLAAAEAASQGDAATIRMKVGSLPSGDETGPTKRMARGGILADPDSQSDPALSAADASDPSTLKEIARPDLDGDGGMDVDLSTRTQRIADLPPLGVPIGARGGTATAPNRAARSGTMTNPDARSTTARAALPRASSSWLAVAFLTFGLLALGMGVGFSFLAPKPTPYMVLAFPGEGGGDVIVGTAEEVPAGVTAREVALDRPQLRARGESAFVDVDPTRLQGALVQAGVWRTASLPRESRERAAALLPVLIAGVGLLALAFALPGLVLVGGVRIAAQLVLVLACAGALAVAVKAGALSWPGLDAWDERAKLEWTSG